MLKLLAPKKLDTKRTFTDLDKKTVFFRDMELCQFCKMNGSDHKVLWEECEIHHVTPHADGGATSIENAALVHRDCHPKGEVNVETFCNWWQKIRYPSTDPNGGSQSFPPPESTKARFEYDNEIYSGEIQDGRLVLSGGHEGICGSFSAASHVVTGTSRNGWRDWELQLPDEEDWILADEWRKRG